MVNGSWLIAQGMSHEPLTINNRLINELSDYILKGIRYFSKNMSCVQEGIDPTSEISQNLLNGYSGFPARLFKKNTEWKPSFCDL